MVIDINPNQFYTDAETRQLLGNLGRSKFYEYRRAGLITPFRIRPTLYLGSDIIEAIDRIMHFRRGEKVNTQADYGIEVWR